MLELSGEIGDFPGACCLGLKAGAVLSGAGCVERFPRQHDEDERKGFYADFIRETNNAEDRAEGSVRDRAPNF